MGLIQDTFGAVSAKLGEIVCTRKVFVPNGKTKRSFEGRIVGRFRRVGPNSWDDYQFVSEDGGPVEVFPGIKVQVDPAKPRFRMRMRGEVALIEWQQDEADETGAAGDRRAALLEDYVEHFGHKTGIGAAAFIAKTLRH